MRRPNPLHHAGRSTVVAPRGMVATSQTLATQTGVEILRAGGSAADAGIAANAVQCLVEPTGCGLGGDLFAQHWSARDGRLSGLDASGPSPAALTLDVLKGLSELPPHGPLPVSVPGCVAGWCELHAAFGRLPLAEILAPAIAYAREGAPIAPVVAGEWQRNAAVLADQPGFARVFMPNGRTPAAGERFRNPALAATLERIASDGRDAFYAGSIAEELERFFVEHDGWLRASDLADFRPRWVEPLSVRYRSVELWELPPPGQGLTALQLAALLDGFEFDASEFGSARHLHAFVECKKLAYEDRARAIADPDFADLPITALLDPAYLDERRRTIRAERANDRVTAGPAALACGDTINLSVADADGNLLSLIQSNFRGMGSGMTPPSLGFSLQDRGQLFDLRPGRANSYAPGKRPFHTIIPAFVTKDGAPQMAFGVMGGEVQPQGHAWILSNLLDFDMDLQAAGDAPRIRHEGSSEPTGSRATDGGEVLCEPGISPEVQDTLRALGHRVREARGGYGGYQAVSRHRDIYAGASEGRKDGCAAGW
ncbi:MAG: gamma-glutamyltransferase family protein [Planctomycetes bacterium]|nr:gamma-glutamyltransferase family protein [Planctomycetota bacterium]